MKKPANPKTLKDWLGLETQFNILSVYWLGHLVTVFFGLLAFMLLALAVILLIDLFLAASISGPYADDVDGSSIRNIGLVLIALFGSPFLVWRSIVAAKLAKTSDDSLFNEKITSFANQLAARRQITRVVFEGSEEKVLTEWEDDLVARAIAIDGLEGLTQERPSIAPRAVRLIASYIRGTFPCVNLTPSEVLNASATPRMDLQKSIDLIGRVLKLAVKVDEANWRLDLTSCNFDGVNFSSGFFRAADLSNCRMEGASFDKANFEGCIFRACLLNYATFFKTNLKGVRFDSAVINKPEPHLGGMLDSINYGNLKGAVFFQTDLSALDYLGLPIDISKTIGSLSTIVHGDIQDDMPGIELHKKAFKALQSREYGKLLNEKQQTLVEALEATGFQNWIPWPSTGGNYHLSKFQKNLGMDMWPFTHT